MALTNETIEKIRKSANIVSFISTYIPISKKGRNYFAVCPFHDDRNPSMSISEDKQIYKCFSCGASGNIFNFVQDYEKVTFPEAVKIVADFVGMDISKEMANEKTYHIDEKEQRLFDLLKEASNFYRYNLETLEGSKGKDYLISRQMDKEIIDKFEIGFALNDGNKLINYLTKKGYSYEEIINAGIGIENNNGLIDRFKGRVIFPLKNLEGKIVAFSGRKIDDSDVAKYLNSPETKIFIKGNCLYNYSLAKQAARKDGKIYVVEGFMDAIALSKIGLDNVVAVMGTAFTENQIKAIKKLNVKVVMCLDNDDAGQDATYRIVSDLEKQGLNCSIVSSDAKGKDVDEILKQGSDVLLKYLNNTISPLDFKMSYQFKHINPENYDEKKEFIIKIADFYAGNVKDDLDVDYYINKLAKITGFSYNSISEVFQKKKQKKIENYPRKNSGKYVTTKPDRYHIAEKNIINQMLNDSKAIRYYVDNIYNLLQDQNYRIIAKIIVNYYYNNSGISANDLISTIEDSKLRTVITDLMYDENLEKSFDVRYFDIIKYERPLEKEIQKLQIQIEQCNDELEKAKLGKLKISKLNELKELKEKNRKGGN